MALYGHAIISELVGALLNFSDTHGIVAKSLLNLINGSHWNIPKLLAKLDAILIINLFCHVEN